MNHGFSRASQRGSHRKWVNASTGVKVIVPDHRGRQLPIGTQVAILGQAGIPDDEWHD